MSLAPLDGSSRADDPIGVFDSGVGGLSVLNALREALPHERFVYFADTGHAPYGERGDAFVAERSDTVARQLVELHRIKALVVACNTATAAAIHRLRAGHPALPVVGVEPALKPAVALSRTGRIAVLATRVTVESGKFRALHASLAGQASFSIVACDGLAGAIERGVHAGAGPESTAEIVAACTRHAQAMGPFGLGDGEIDTLVLGCTHYPFAGEHLRELLGSQIQFLDTGVPVARQTRLRLAAATQGDAATQGTGQVRLFTTGQPATLQAAAQRWLQLGNAVESLQF